MKKIAHSATEHLILGGIILFGLIPLMYYSLGYFQSHYSISQLEESTQKLINTADSVLDLGEGNQKQVVITLPKTVSGGLITGNSIVYTGQTFSNVLPVDGRSKAKLIGILPAQEGTHRVSVKHVGNYVKIGDQPYLTDLLPSSCQTIPLSSTLTINGYDIASEATILVNNNPYSSSFITSLTGRSVTFTLDPATFVPGTYTITLQNPNGDMSNALSFTIVTNILFCYNPEEIVLAQRVNENNHKFHSDITPLVLQLDGTYHEINQAFMIHTQFQNPLNNGNKVLIRAVCQQVNGVIYIREEGGTTIYASNVCPQSLDADLVFTLSGMSAPSDVLDIFSPSGSTNVRYDYIASSTTA